MTRISTSELYNNRNIIKQICDLQDEIGESKISNVAFSRTAEQVTLTITMEDASTKTTSFADRSVTNVTASQTGAVVTLTFTMSDGTTYPITFTASGSGGATITAGQGITVTGDPLTGYVVAVDNSYVATKSSVNDLTQRVLQAEAQVAAIDGVVRGMTSQINANTQGIATNVAEINLLNGRLGSETLPGTILGRIKSLEEAEVTIDTSNFSSLPGHVPGSVLVANSKMNEPDNVGHGGQILACAGPRRSVWVDAASGLAMDSSMSDTSVNPVKNKVIKGYVDAADTVLNNAIESLEDEIGTIGQAGTIRDDIHNLEDEIGAIGQTGSIRDDIHNLEDEIGAIGQSGTIRDDIHNLNDNKQDYNNLVIEWETTPSHSKYPSAKLVYDNCVRTSGNQTIAGGKTFTNTTRVEVTAGASAIIKKATDKDITQVPTELFPIVLISSIDMNGVIIGNIQLRKANTGKVQLACHLRNNNGTYKTIVLAESD